MRKGVGQVKEFLLSRGISAQIVELGASAKNSQLAAKALGCTVGEIAKSVVFTGPRTMVVVLSGEKRVNLEKLSLVAGSKLTIASAEEVKTLTGYVDGGVPPFPHDDGIGLYPDLSLKTYPRVWAAAGEQNAVMQISVKELIETIGSDVVEVSSSAT
ncbi:MAG: YbaK/EbsC family protein [Thaumarchaeota archaeon]|nr:YbaK/EbsC family protein [Nitrososphaerota archaeon]